MSDLSDLSGDLKGLHISLNHLLDSCKELRCCTLEIFQDFHELLEKCSEKCKYVFVVFMNMLQNVFEGFIWLFIHGCFFSNTKSILHMCTSALTKSLRHSLQTHN